MALLILGTQVPESTQPRDVDFLCRARYSDYEMTSRVRQVLAELHARLKDLYGERLVKLVLFGSQARGDAGPDSDIDVMLVLNGPVSHDVESDMVVPITAELSLQNGVVISTIYMSAERYAKESSSLLLNVREEGVAV